MVKDNSEFNAVLEAAGITDFYCVDADNTPQAFRWHYLLDNPLDFLKVKKCVPAFSAVNHAPVEVVPSKIGHFAISISRESERAFPHLMSCNCSSVNGDMVIGVDENYRTVTRNIKETRSILVAGSSGGGKSVTLGNMIISLALNSSPAAVQMILIDLKRVEFSLYKDLPHLALPPITEAKAAIDVLKSLLNVISARYLRMEKLKRRSMSFEEMPAIVTFIDEYAELATNGGVQKSKLDETVSRVAAVGRACNVYLIISTQHPINSIISNSIRVNLPSQIGLRTANTAQSVNIIGNADCCRLYGKGDAIISIDGELPQRVQMPFLSDEDIEQITTKYRKLKAAK